MSLDTDIPLLLSLVFMVGGLYVLAKSADMFIDGAGALARHFGVSPLIVGMVIIGFGTSAPELAVSALSGIGGHSNLSLGNAYGSCIFNIGAILGVAALIRPTAVKPSVVWIAAPLLMFVTALSRFVISDHEFERVNGITLLAAFAIIMPLYCWYDQKFGKSAEASAPQESAPSADSSRGLGREGFRLLAGLVLLVLSSHVLVWGSVDFARDVLHVSDLLIGLTIVAAGTSLPELASAIVSARKGESEFVIGNIVGSNLFNTLAVVGLAGTISPFSNFSPYILSRDLPLMFGLSLSLSLFGLNFRDVRKDGLISRWKGAIWLLVLLAYLVFMVYQETSG
jgi:cation:H+ antiporter